MLSQKWLDEQLGSLTAKPAEPEHGAYFLDEDEWQEPEPAEIWLWEVSLAIPLAVRPSSFPSRERRIVPCDDIRYRPDSR